MASWRQLVDAGTLQRDEPELAGTARPTVVRIGTGTAGRLGVLDGDRVTVSGATGAVTLPVRITAMPDQVVWLPLNSGPSRVGVELGVSPGATVSIVAGGVR